MRSSSEGGVYLSSLQLNQMAVGVLACTLDKPTFHWLSSVKMCVSAMSARFQAIASSSCLFQTSLPSEPLVFEAERTRMSRHHHFPWCTEIKWVFPSNDAKPQNIIQVSKKRVIQRMHFRVYWLIKDEITWITWLEWWIIKTRSIKLHVQFKALWLSTLL